MLLQQGCVIANGTLNDTFARLDLPTAHLDDAGTVIEGKVAQHDKTYHLTRLDFPGGNLWVGRVKQPLGSSARD